MKNARTKIQSRNVWQAKAKKYQKIYSFEIGV